MYQLEEGKEETKERGGDGIESVKTETLSISLKRKENR
jgi:hypothetical protein